MDEKEHSIRFINSSYDTLFRIPDGGTVEVQLRIRNQTSVFAGVWLRAFFIFRKCAGRQLSVSQKRAAHTKCEKGFGKPNMQASVWKNYYEQTLLAKY